MAANDLQLLQKWRTRRDADAFTEIVRRHGAMVYATCKRILGNAADAEDVAQDCLLQLAESSGRIQTSVVGWLHRLATHRSLDRIKSVSRRRRREDEASVTGVLIEDPEWDAVQRHVDEAIADLPPESREVVIHHFLEGESYHALGRRLRLSHRAVKYRADKAIQAIRDRLRRHGFDVGSAFLVSAMSGALLDAAPPALVARLGKIAIAGVSSRDPISPLPARAGPILWTSRVVKTAAVAGAAALVALLVLRTPEPQVSPGPRGDQVAEMEPEPTDGAPVADAASAPAASPSVTTTLRVRVVWAASREPVPGAAVALSLTEEDAILRESVCDERGELSIEVPDDWRTAWLAIRHETAVGLDAPVELPANDTLTFELDLNYVITGTVTDSSTGEPIPGAEVKPWATRAQPLVADSAGIYELQRDGPGEHTFIVWAHGHARKIVTVQITEPSTQRDVALNRAEEVLVTVRDADGLPVEGAEVEASHDEDGGAYLRESVALTDRYGQARVWRDSTFRRHDPQFAIAKSGYVVSTIGDLQPNDRGDWTLEAVLTRPAERAVEGRITDEDGHPLGGVVVGWNDGSMRWGPGGVERRSHAVSNANGDYRLVFRNKKTEFTLVAYGPGWAPTLHRDIVAGTSQEPAKLDFVMTSGHRVRGQVVDEDGVAVEGVRVKAFPPESAYAVSDILAGVPHDARTDADGRFLLGDLPGPRVMVDFDARDFSRVMRRPFAVDGEVLQVLYRPGIVRGRVVDAETGKPVTEFTVKIRSGPTYATDRRTVGESFSSSDGTFVLKSLHRGDQPSIFTFTVEAADYAPALLEKVEVPGGDEAPEHTVQLQRGRHVRAYVVEAESGEPIPGAHVVYGEPEQADVHWSEWVLKNMHNYQKCVTDGDGAFRVFEARPGTLFVQADGYGRLILRPEDRPEDLDDHGELVIELARGQSLAGTYLKGGEPTGGELVLLIRLDAERLRSGRPPRESWEGVRTGADGRFGWNDLPAGRYLIQISRVPPKLDRTSTWIRFPVEVAPGGPAEVMIDDRVLGQRTLRGALLDTDGKPHDGVSLTLLPLFDLGVAELSTHVRDGRFTFAALRPGRYRVEAFSLQDPRGRVVQLQDVDVTADHEVQWTVTLPGE